MVEPDVHEWPHAQFARRGALHIVKAQRDPELLEKAVHAIVVPTDVAEFDSVLPAFGQRSEKVFEAIEINFPPGRKLIEHWTKMRAELRRALEETEQRILWIFQFLHVRQEPARFDGINKTPRRLLTPLRERGRRRQSIKAVVDFDCVERSRVVGEPERLRQIGRIEIASPVFVLPARAADPYLLS